MTIVQTIRIVKGNKWGSPMPEVKRQASLNPPVDMADAPALPIVSYRGIARLAGARVWKLEAMTQTAPEEGEARARARGELFTASWRRGNIRATSGALKRTFHPFSHPFGGNTLPIGLSANNTRNSEAYAV